MITEKCQNIINLINKHFNKDFIERVTISEKQIVENINKNEINYNKYDEIVKNEEEKEKFEKNIKEDNKHSCSQDHRKEIEIYEKSNYDKLKITEEFKESGNKFFKENKLDKANFFYQRCLIYLTYTIPKSDQEQKKFDELTIKINSNLSLLELKNENYSESLNYISQVLRLDNINEKSLLRKCKVLLESDEFNNCEKALEDLFKIYPSNNEGKIIENQLKNKIDKYNIKKKEIFKNSLN